MTVMDNDEQFIADWRRGASCGGELLGLRREDVDLLHGVLKIRSTRVVTMGGKAVTKGPKTAAGIRTVAVPDFLVPEIEIHLERYVAVFVFVGVNGEPLGTSTLYRNWDKARRSIHRPDLTLHDLRHTGLTLAAASGASTAELMRRAGHSSFKAAMRYQHATSDRDRVLAEALGELASARRMHVNPDKPEKASGDQGGS